MSVGETYNLGGTKFTYYEQKDENDVLVIAEFLGDNCLGVWLYAGEDELAIYDKISDRRISRVRN